MVDDGFVQPLVGALGVVMSEVFLNGDAQTKLAQRDDAAQIFLFERTKNAAMGVRSVRRERNVVRGCAASADVRRVLPAVSPRRGRVPSPHVMDAAGGRAPARALGRGCCLAPAYSSAPGWLADDRVRFPPAVYVGSSPLKITVPLAHDFGAPGPSQESILAGFPVRESGRDPR